MHPYGYIYVKAWQGLFIGHSGVSRMVTNGNKKVVGGSWLLLTLLMIGMSWGQAVPPAGDVTSTTSVDEAEANNAVDPFALNVGEYATVDYT